MRVGNAVRWLGNIGPSNWTLLRMLGLRLAWGWDHVRLQSDKYHRIIKLVVWLRSRNLDDGGVDYHVGQVAGGICVGDYYKDKLLRPIT